MTIERHHYDWKVGVDADGMGHFRVGRKGHGGGIAMCSGCMGGPSPVYLVDIVELSDDDIVECLWCHSLAR